MVKKSLISIITQEEKEKNSGSIEFQVSHFTNKIQRLTSHLQLHKRNVLITKGSTNNFGKTSMIIDLFVKEK